MTTGSNNIIDDLVCLIHQYYPTEIPFNDPLYQSSDEYKKLKEKQQQMAENADYLAFIEKNLKKIFSQYAVINWTYMEEYPDIEYHILLHKNQDILDDDIRLLERLNGERRDLFVYISIIGKYYFFTINKTEKKNEKAIFSFDELHGCEEQERIAELEEFFSSQGYIQIDKATANFVIDNVETECSEMGHTTIFKCLFNGLWPIDK